MVYVAGWDGGGTKTEVVCLTTEGDPLARAAFGPLNPNGAPESEVEQTVRQALAWMRSLGVCESLAVSSAGVSNPETGTLLRRLLQEGGYGGILQLIGDQESALYGAVGDHGTVLVSGTGSICYGRAADGRTARCGGYGYLVDDGGSGYAIGRDILTAVLRASDGRTPPTRLTGLLAQLDPWRDAPSILRTLYRSNFEKAQVAALAPLALEAGDDPAAVAILEAAARELTLLATSVIDRLGLENERIAFTGSVLTRMAPVREEVTNALLRRYPHIQGFAPLADAATGAARMALRQRQTNTAECAAADRESP